MGVAEWIGLGSFVVAFAGGCIAWAARVLSKLSEIANELKWLGEFRKETIEDRANLWERSEQHGELLSEHGERLTAVETKIELRPARR